MLTARHQSRACPHFSVRWRRALAELCLPRTIFELSRRYSFQSSYRGAQCRHPRRCTKNIEITPSTSAPSTIISLRHFVYDARRVNRLTPSSPPSNTLQIWSSTSMPSAKNSPAPKKKQKEQCHLQESDKLSGTQPLVCASRTAHRHHRPSPELGRDR